MSPDPKHRQLKRLLDKYEEMTDAVLRDVCGRYETRVCPKVGLKEVLPIEGSGLSDPDFRYALQAHFDFVVADKSSAPLFAVEFDGESHRSEKQKRRDEKKNFLCEMFEFPLLRVNSRYLTRKYRGMDLLSWFIDVWFMAEAFFEAQDKGHIPPDEPFDPCGFMSWSNHKRRFPLWLTLEIQLKLQSLDREGKCLGAVPKFVISADQRGNCHALAYLKVNPEHAVVVTTGMRRQLFPVSPSEALQQIVFFDIYHELQRVLSGYAQPIAMNQVNGMLKFWKENYKLLRACF